MAVDNIKDTSDLMGKMTEVLAHFSTNLDGILEKIGAIPGLFGKSQEGVEGTVNATKNANDALAEMHKTGLSLLNDIVAIGSETINTFEAMASGSRENVDNLGELNKGVMAVLGSFSLMALGAPTAFKSLGDVTKSAASDISGSFGPAFDGLIDILSKVSTVLKIPDQTLLTAFKKFVDTTGPAIDQVNNLETSLLTLHGASGDLTKTFEDSGSSYSKLTNLTNEFNNSIVRTAQNTGASIPSVVAFTGEVLKIPGLYNDIIKTNLGENISYTESAMKVARGTSQDYGVVLGITAEQYENMNKSGNSSLELMSRMYSVQQSLGIPFNYVSGLVKNVSEQFKFLGDNTQGALNIIEGLSPKLLASGLGPKAVQELIGNVVTQLNSLDVAQKSLLSSRTGGAGGLQGGFQIDQLLAEGKIDEVYKKMETALKQQFGGKVTTLKEGSESQSAAGQLQKEVSFLTQGPFGALVKSSGEAYKLLESFKSGAAPTQAKTEDELKTGLGKTIDTGKAIDQLQYTELQKIANATEALRINSSQQLGLSSRDVARTDLGKEQTSEIPSRYMGTKNTDAATNIAHEGADVFGAIRTVGSKAVDYLKSLTPTENKAQNITPNQVEVNAARPNNNHLTPTLPTTPDKEAAEHRRNVLKSAPDHGTVLASTGAGKDQTLTIKVVSTGLDSKTEERIMAKYRVQAAEMIEKAKDNENSSAVHGYK
jgi:hypothetical protein